MTDKGMRIVEAEMTCCEVARGIDELVKQAVSHQLEAIKREVEGLKEPEPVAFELAKLRNETIDEVLSIIDGKGEE